MTDSQEFGLEIPDSLMRLLESGVQTVPMPSSAHLKLLINTAFFASMQQEEGRHLTFAIALVDREMLGASNMNRRDWSPVKFRDELPLSVSTIAKLALAVDFRQTLLAVMELKGRLVVIGLIRSNSMHYRFRRGEADGASGYVFEPFIVRATGAGDIEIFRGYRQIVRLSRASILLSAERIRLFDHGPIYERLLTRARVSSLDGSLSLMLIRLIINDLVERRHGGILLLLDDNNLEGLEFQYSLSEPSPAIRQAVEFAQGASLGPSCRASDHLLGQEPDPKATNVEFERRRAIEEVEFLRDAASFAADLASLDKALVLNQDFRIAGFGAEITCNSVDEPAERIYRLALDVNANQYGKSPLESLGTRHNSTARYCRSHPEAIGLVVSQDGIVTCMLRKKQQEWVNMWRPVAMET